MSKIKYLFWDLWYKYKEWRFERKCIKHFGMKPTKMFVSEEQFNALVEALNKPSDPEVVERFKQIMSKKAPWDE